MSAVRELLSHGKHPPRRRGSKRRVILKCRKCGAKHTRKNQRWCAACHAEYMRTWRKTHPLTVEQRFKDNSRSYANSYQSRGKLIRVPCEKCGSPRSEKHHLDYDKPLDVVWLCRPCHLAHHADLKRQVIEVPAKPERDAA